MNPGTLQLIVYLEGLVALVAQSVAEIKGVVSGDSTKAVADILSDADANYQKLITNAQPK